MDRRPTDDAAPRPSEETRELRVDTGGTDWAGAPSPRRVATAPNSPATAFHTDREAIYRSGNATVAETHLIRSTGSQSQSFTEEHWSSEITSFVTAAPPKFIQVIKAYRILSSDTPTLVVEVASDPPAIFEWFCNDRPVQQDRRRFQARHGLNITTLTVHQPEQGVYKCTARNPAGVSTSYGYITVNFEHQYDEWTIVDRSMATEEGQTTVTVHRSPRFINQVPNLTIQPGSEAVIDVEVEADPPARFAWFVNGREFRKSSSGVELFYPAQNRCIVKFTLPVSGEYKVVASNVHGSAMSSGYVEIHRANPSKQMRPPTTPGEHLSRNIMSASHHVGSTSTGERDVVQTHQAVSVYEVNYTQRASSVPRGVRHLESHVEVPTSPKRKISLEQHRAEPGKKLPDRLPRSLYKTRSEGARYLPHAPRFITSLPPQIAVNPNEKLVLSVDVAAVPTAGFKWDVNGFEVKPTRNVTLLNEQNRSTLVVQPPVKQGKYQVVAFNDEGRESLMTRVIHETTTLTQAQTETTTEAKPRPDILLESSVTVTSAKDVDWEMLDSVSSTRSTTSFQTVTRREPPLSGELPTTELGANGDITPVKEVVGRKPVVQEFPLPKNDEIAVTTSLSKSTAKVKPHVNMPKKPVLLSAPEENVYLKTGETLVLELKVDSIPPATFRWYVNNFEAKNGQFVSIAQPSENVSVATFLKPSTGHYKAVAANPLGKVATVTRVTSEQITEGLHEHTTVVTTAKPTLFKLTKKPLVTVREDLPKAPRIVEKLPTFLRIGEKEPLSLKVMADAVPEATFMWLLNNFELKRNPNLAINRLASNTSELTLQKVQPGRYDVVARNRLGQDSSSCKVIVVYDQVHAAATSSKPVFTQALPMETTVFLDKETKLEVVASGSRPFGFTWLVSGAELSSCEDFEIVSEGNRSALLLRKSLGNGTVLTVQVSNNSGSAMSETIIKEVSRTLEVVEEPTNLAPVFEIKLENIQMAEGETLRCHVKVTEDSEDCTFEWFANELLITTGDQVLIESSPRESKLSIENMGKMDGVELTAVARNKSGSSACSARLDVVRRPDESFEMVPLDVPEESAPKIIEPLHSASFLDGQPMVLRCRIKAVPSAVIVWSKDDINVDEWVINKDIITQILPDGICELMNPEVYPEDSGLYKCTASNPHGTAETAAYINIEGIKYNEEGSTSDSAVHPEEWTSPPKFVEQLTAETDGAYDLNYVRLICRVKSASPVIVSWMKNGAEIVPSEKYELHEFSDGALILTIYSPCTADDGVYTCKAESTYGLSSSSCAVMVPAKETTTEKVAESGSETMITVEPSTLHVIEANKEDYVATTEITKHEEEYKLLVKVADSVASALVANIFVDAVREAVKRIMEESEEEEEIEVTNAPRFETSIERYVVTENDTVTISTTVSGYPTPFIEWYFKDQKLGLTEQISMGYEKRTATLILKNVTFAQEGTYYCHATNTHGTTVLPSEVKVVPEKPGDTVRLTMAKYEKAEGSERLMTNIFAYHTDEEREQTIGLHAPEKESTAACCSAPVAVQVMVVKQPLTTDIAEQTLEHAVAALQATEEASAFVEAVQQPPRVLELHNEPPVPMPRKQKPDVVAVSAKKEAREEDQGEPDETAMRLIAIKFADSFTENVMCQAETDLRTKAHPDEMTYVIKAAPRVEEQRHEETKIATTVEKTSAALSAVTPRPQTATVVSSQEIVNEEVTTVDVRKPNVQFDHEVTVVEPEVVQLGVRLSSPNVPSLRFIDLETILQRPGTSSSANTQITAPHRGSANAEHRIVLLEGASQRFQNAMTLSLKKVKRLAAESAEPSTFVQIEILKPNEATEAVLTIVNTEKIIPDLLRIAAAASKLKMENVTVSLVKQGDTAHQELVIEYESCFEDAVEFNLSQLVYSHKKEESIRQETWSRRSRYSEVDENVVAVFMEVDANCPDQSVEIVASVRTPLEEKVDRRQTPSPELMEISESITESSSAMGQQTPRFFRTLQNCEAVIGRSAQFKCIVSGMPPPTVAWFVDGDAIQACREYEIVYEDGVCILRINEVLAEDEGEYSCEATNAAGKAVTKCYLKVLSAERPQRYIEHAPSVAELVDDADSFDSFEFEEHKANSLFPSENGSLRCSSVTYNSEFDLSKVVNYNEDMEETNAFHKYFDTAEATAKVTEREQRERVFASFLTRLAESAYVDVVLPKPASFGSAFYLKPECAFHGAHAALFGTVSKDIEAAELKRLEQSECVLKKRLGEPRAPDLPVKLSYKGQEIAVSVSEVEKEEIKMNENGEYEIFRKTCLETSLEFETEVDITQSIRKIYNALPDQTADFGITPDSGSGMLSTYKEIFDPSLTDYVLSADPIVRERVTDPKEGAPVPSARSDSLPLISSEKTTSDGAAELESSLFDPDFLSKMREIERIARQVDEELGQLSSPVPVSSQPDDVKEIENAIFKISDQLLLAHPITEAQAEANEELLRTTLADMILNPARTAQEELELMKRPIRLIKRKLSDIENSLMEDAEVTDITEHACSATDADASTETTDMAPASRARNGPKTGRVPSAEYLRVTPLTSNIKDQLSCLEEMITEHMHSETPDSTVVAEAASVVESPKKRELHDLFVQINSEINTIRTHCKSRLSKKGTDAVMNVLQKVRTHVTSIVNVMSLSKRKQSKSLEKVVESVSATYVLARPLPEESIEVVVMVKSSSLENSVTRKSSTVVSSSDDTWKYMTELNSLLERAPVLPKIEAERGRDVVKEVKPAPAANREDGAPIPPPRRRRTVSAGPEESDELPVRPPRKKKADVTRRDCSLESKRTSAQADLQKKYATIGPTSTTTRDNGSVSPPSKPKRSLAGDTFDLLRNLSCMRAQKDQVEDLERSLLEELSQMAVSKDDDEVLSEPDWVQTEVNQSLKRGAERAKLEESFEKRIDAPTVSEISKVLLAESRTKGGEYQSKHLKAPAQMASSQYSDEFHSEPEWVHTEITRTTETGPRLKEEEPISEREQDQPSKYEKLDESDRANGHDAKQISTGEKVPPQSEENISASFEGASLSAAFLLLSEATASLEIPLTSVMLMSGNMSADDGVSSVQMTCEESDYATDTDTSALLKGTVQFFERYSPRGATPQSISSFSASQRSSKLLPELIETEEHACIDVQLEVVLNKSEDSVVEAAELTYPVKDAVAKDEQIETGIAQGSAADSNSTGKGSVSDETVHLVLEETLLSQMASSEWTDDTDRMTPLSRIGVRETDILSDDSVVTEIDRCDIEESFCFVRAEARKGLVAVVFLEVRQAAAAKIADNTFDVEIRQEPESLALMIRVIEDQMNFTSLTVEFSEQSVNARACDDFDDTSSFEDVDGESRTGITVSIIARSLHDGIYASLEEIPWGEVEMSLQECEVMAKSMEEDSKTSLQFNVVVSESTPEERKSLRSQASLNQSQNTISEVDNTLSTGSINIPSYVIKLGSTATITCELNNYLPPNSKIVWYKGTYEIVTSPGKIDRISHDLLEVLIINDVQMEDNELYSLKVNDDIFPVAYLIVEPSSVEEFAATILSPPQTQFVMEGQPTVLMCQVSDPGQGVVWLKDRKPLQESGRLQMENCRDGWHRVVFSHTRMSDQGTYFAFLGEQSVAITLVVEERIDEKEVTVVASGTESEDDDVQEYLMPPGSTATIACELEEGDHLHSLVWLKNGQRITFNDPNKIEHVVNGLKHYLVIHDTSPKDTGLYSVSISNTEFRVAHLAVNDLATASQSLRRKRISNTSLQ